MAIEETVANSYSNATVTGITTITWASVAASTGLTTLNFDWASTGVYPVDANAIGVTTTSFDGLELVADGFVDNVSSTVQITNILGPIIELVNPIGAFTIESTFPSLGIKADLLEGSFTITDDTAFGETTLVSGVMNWGESLTFTYKEWVNESYKAFGIINSIDQTTSLSSTAKLSESINIIITATLSETANVSDTQELIRLVEILDQFKTFGTATNSALALTELTSTFKATESTTLGLTEFPSSTLQISEVTTDLLRQWEIITDTFTVTDVQVLNRYTLESIQDTFKIFEELTFDGSSYNVFVVSTLEAKDIIWAADLEAIAWVMNTEGESIVPLRNFGFHSIEEHGGQVFAATPEGIFELTGDTDNGRDIAAHIKYGFNDFGSPNRKRASDLYVSYKGTLLECKIETYDGPKNVYNYSIENRSANAPRNNRMKVGRGLVSRYWRTEVHNREGAAFKVYDISLNAYTSKRRL